MLARGESRTDWRRVRALTQQDADRLAEEDDGHLPKDWESAVETGLPKRKQGVHIRLDSDVLDWFRAQGPGYQTRINAVLRAFVRARERVERAEPKAK
ncbi:MAG: BrnA antitoxin family protein [Beijerinckiaceae bacterium]